MTTKEKTFCSTEGCYNEKEYGDEITYYSDYRGNIKYSAELLDFCLVCRINNKKGNK